MPQTAGKPLKKSSKTKSSSTSKRHFTIVIGSKEHGLYVSSSPSSAARKAVSKLCGKEKGKKVEFCLREITQGSKKKTYGPYLGHIEKLAKPIELKGRVIERTPVARLKPKSSAKKGGMRGGDIDQINVILGNCGRSRRFGVWKNDCITLTHGQNKVVLYYNTDTEKIEVRYFDNFKNNVYSNSNSNNRKKKEFILDKFTINIFKSILGSLVIRGEIDDSEDDSDARFIIQKIINTCKSKTLPIHCSKIVECLKNL